MAQIQIAMKIIYTLILLVSCQGYSISQTDTTSNEYQEHIKQEKELLEQAKKKTDEKKLKSSIFGTKSTSYNFSGYNYDSYADGKYSEVAKAENWSKWSLPENMDKRLESYKRKKILRYTSIILGLLVLGFIVAKFSRRLRNSND